MSRAGRLEKLVELGLLSEREAAELALEAGPLAELADNLSENVIGAVAVPLGVATNLTVDGQDVLVAMATEESSVIAAVSNGARACRELGGVFTEADDPCMIAQVQITGLQIWRRRRLKWRASRARSASFVMRVIRCL